MTTALEYFRIFAPEFADMPDATVEIWLDIAADQINVECLDENRAAQAQALYAAHLISLSQRAGSGGGSAGAAGPLIREREGDLERQYAAPNMGSNGAMGPMDTVYSMQYMELTRACFGATIMTRNG